MIRDVNTKINKVLQLGQIFVNERLKPHGLSSGVFYFILELADQEYLTMQELSKAVCVDNGYTTRIVNKLIDMGYVTKVQNPMDSRSSIVCLTDKGRDVSEVVKQVMLDWINIISKGIASNDIETVNAVFGKFYENAKGFLNGATGDINTENGAF